MTAFVVFPTFAIGSCTNPVFEKLRYQMQVLKRINSEIEARRKAGENLPPPPKTAIAGPEYFGLNQPEVGYRPTYTLQNRVWGALLDPA